MSKWEQRVIDAACIHVKARRNFESLPKDVKRREKTFASQQLVHADEKLASAVDAYLSEINI